MKDIFQLQVRKGNPTDIGQVPPQLQFSDLGSDEIRLSLKKWAFNVFPNVREHDTLISVPSSRALWLDEKVPAAHDDAFMPPQNSREFCHLHEDGSFHTVVNISIEDEILKKQWDVRHMYYDRGVKEVLVHAPRDEKELISAKKIIVESYRYASGDIEFRVVMWLTRRSSGKQEYPAFYKSCCALLLHKVPDTLGFH